MAKTKNPSTAVKSAADASDVFEANGAAFAAALKASEAMFAGVAEINREVMSFAGDRLRQGVETSGSLIGCHDPAEAFGVQCEHARRATQAYLEEATRLMTLAAKLSDECLQSMAAQTRETIERAAAAPTTKSE